MRIVVLDGHTLDAPDRPWNALQAHGTVEVHDRSSPAEVSARAQGAGILVTNKARIPAEVIDGSPTLRFVAVSATGYDCVDVAAARRRGIPVAHVPEYGTDAVAQFVVALLLHWCHDVGGHAAAVRAGAWERSPDFCFWMSPQVELAGKTFGILGFGRIGRRVGELAHALGMAVLAHSRSMDRPPAYQPFAWAGLDELLERADVLSLHCPLTPATAGLIDRARLQRIKPGAFLINAARGGLVVEQDLADALDAGRLAGAAVDVLSQEPPRPDNPLMRS